MITGHTVMDIVLLTHVAGQGGHFTREQGIVYGSTTITVDPDVFETVTEEHPKMHDSNAFLVGSRINVDGVVIGCPKKSVPVINVVAMVTCGEPF